jgi:phage shock protein E
LLLLAVLVVAPASVAASTPVPPNPAIDMPAYLRIANEAAEYREGRRVSEEDFIRMSREPGTIVLDARSRNMYDLLHVKGAVHLAFTDFSTANLARVIPDSGTRVLIYCNNNFRNAERAFFLKAPPASLNLSTFIALYTYGYRNVYELGPRIDATQAKLELVPTAGNATR